MNDSFKYGRHRSRENYSFFSPVSSSKSHTSSQRHHNDSTPKSSHPVITTELEMESILATIEKKDVDSFTELLMLSSNQNVDVNQVIPGYHMTLLHHSVGCSDNDITIVEALLMLGGDPNNINIEEKVSPLHLAALYDYDHVMRILIEFGGDPKIPNGDGETCFDIVKRNVEDELLERCFIYLFPRSRDFRKSMGPALNASQNKSIHNKKQPALHDSGSDGFYSCESQLVSEGYSHYTQNERIHSIARRLCPNDYTNLMTEDESAAASDDDEDEVRKKLTTIPEESGIVSSSSPKIPTFSSFTPSPFKRCRGIGSMTAPLYLLTDDSISVMSDSELSCVNSTPPITPQPTKSDLAKLQEQMKQLSIPITPTTFNVMSKFAGSNTQMQALLTPKTGVRNFSSELQAGIQNISLIHEWGNLKIDFLQNATPTANTSKSFYNYLLLDPRIIKKANFSGDHLKAAVINNTEKFLKYLESVFYIGKAHGKRPLQHLVEAKQRYAEMARTSFRKGEKIDKILDIWKSGMGVIIVSVFHHSSEREANVNEASMIDAMGLVELSNIKRGSYLGTAAQGWSQKTKNQLGSLLLFTSFRSFVVNDPKQFFPSDF